MYIFNLYILNKKGKMALMCPPENLVELVHGGNKVKFHKICAKTNCFHKC